MIDKIKNNRMLLSIIGIIALVLLVTGITYAGFSKTSSSGNNSISSGTISMSFQEPSNNVVITNAMPVSGTNYTSTTHFDFSVSGTAKAALTIPYEISITEKPGNTLASSDVMIGLKKNGTILTGFTSGKLASSLTSSTIRNGSKVLLKDELTLTQSGSNHTGADNYQLFLWIKESAVTPNDGSTKSYSITININSDVGAIGVTTGTTTKYVVSKTEMSIGSTLPNGVYGRDTAALAMDDWEDLGGEIWPFYLKHILNGSNEIEESYVEFIVTDDMATANSGMVAGTYTLKGGDSGGSYASNVNAIKSSFGYNSYPSRCTNTTNNFSCHVGSLYVEAGSDGHVIAAESSDLLIMCIVRYSAISNCINMESEW